MVVLDEDEFTAHRRQWGYPDFVVGVAMRTASEMLAAMSGPNEPFGSVWRRWLRVARERFPDRPA